MKLSKQYITEKLETMTVRELAEQITKDMQAKYEADGTLQGWNDLGYTVQYEKTVAKFESMIRPFAPVKAVDAMRSLGVTVVEVK